MDRYFYSVELDEYGNKGVHMSGNVYLNDVDETETNYRCAEWTSFCITLDKLKEFFANDCFYDYVGERINYMGDITETEATEICERYFNGTPGTYLAIECVNEETPCGNYWSE